MPYIENHSEFIVRQGSPARWVKNRWLLANGAQSDGNRTFFEPPTDPDELAQLRHEYLLAEIVALEKEYTGIETNIGLQAEYFGRGCGASPDSVYPGWGQHLKKLDQQILKLREEAAKLSQRLPIASTAIDYNLHRNAERAGATDVMRRLQQART